MKFKKGKLHSSFTENIWGTDMQLISKFNKRICLLLWFVEILSKYAGVSLWMIKMLLQLLRLYKKY